MEQTTDERIRAFVRQWKDQVFRQRTLLLALYLAWFLTPLLLSSIYRPFGSWDYLTSGDLFHFNREIRWTTLLSNYFHHLLTAGYVLRPTIAFLYDLQWLLFGGQFWLWYLVKWAAHLAAALVVVRIAKSLGFDWAARAAIAVFLLMHHARFVLMLHAPDGWVALGILLQLALAVECRGETLRMRPLRLAAFYALAVFTIGAKETGYLFEGTFVVFLWAMQPAAWRRLAPAGALLTFWTIRLLSLSGRAAGFETEPWMERLSEQWKLMTPGSPAALLTAGMAVAAGVSLWIIWKQRHLFHGRLLAFCWISGAAMLAFTTIPPYYGLRYEIPSLYVLSLPLVAALDHLLRRRAWLTACLIVLYPLLTAGQVYTQELAYHQEFFSEALMLHRMDEAGNAGAALAMTGMPGDFDGERLSTVVHYFARTGVEWFGLKNSREVTIVGERGWPQGRFILLSRWSPHHLLRDGPGKLDRKRVERIQAVLPAEYGTMWRLREWYARLDRALGYTGPYAIDYGGAVPTSGPYCYLYEVAAEGATPNLEWAYEEVRFPRTPGAF